MDGKHRSPSLALIFASVPVQALMLASVVAAVFGGGPPPQPHYGMQVSPDGQTIYVFQKPGWGCWAAGGSTIPFKGPGLQYNWHCPVYTADPARPAGTQIVTVPCCGYDPYNNSAP
jgi:hypothetical protein